MKHALTIPQPPEGSVTPLSRSELTESNNDALGTGTNVICWVSVIIDANGVPQDPKVILSLDPRRDQDAIDAVKNYRFKPATNGYQPVPVRVTVEVNFRLHK